MGKSTSFSRRLFLEKLAVLPIVACPWSESLARAEDRAQKPVGAVEHNSAAASSSPRLPYLSAESLAMPRARISFRDRDLRLFNIRGSVAFRQRTVTGLKAQIFPPFNLSDPQMEPPLSLSDSGHFNLSFREETTGALIQDIQDEFPDPLYLNQSVQSSNDLGPHYTKEKSTRLLLSQDATWNPECFLRRGTYHRRESGSLISFGIESRVSLSATSDDIYEEIVIENRLDRTLVLTVIPDQPRTGTARQPCFVRQEGEFQIEIVSDLEAAGTEGWRVSIPPNSSRIARFALLLQKAGSPQPTTHYHMNLADRIASGRGYTQHLLQTASERLPQIKTDNNSLDEFYQRSILSVLLCRRERENFVANPFYDLGAGRGASTPWDMAFSGALLANLDAKGLLGMLLAFFASGSALECSYLSWNGKPSGWYAQTPFSLWGMLREYILYTGDNSVWDRTAGKYTVFECVRRAGEELISGYLKPDGLIDVGAGTGKLLELRTEGYQHAVGVINALAADFFSELALLCQQRGVSSGPRFQDAAERVEAALNMKLWNEQQGWYENLYPDGSRHLVLSYHVFDMLGARSVPLERKRRLAERLREGDFLSTYGMFSISPMDHMHFDREDCDWGGGGQYVGQSLKIVELLYRIDEPVRAWDLLSRCTRWVERFPYFPQTIYADVLELQPHQVDWPLQVSSGAGAQAVLAGVFGFMPQIDGSMIVSPHYNPSLGRATLEGYHFRGHTYSLKMDATKFSVSRDGVERGSSPHGRRLTIS